MSNHNRLVEQIGVSYICSLAGQLKYLCRLVTQHDKGVDLEIELTQHLGVVSPIIAVQVKSRTKLKITAKKKISITVKKQNIQYWRTYGRPVVLMVYSTVNSEVYWTRVDNATSPNIEVDLNQKFDDSTIHKFTQIISHYYASIARNLNTKDVSEIISKLGNTVDEVLKPVEQKLKMANALFWDRKYREAAKIYEPLSFLYEENQSLRYNWLLCLLGLGECDRVIVIVNELLEKSPDELGYYNLLAAGLELAGKDEEAERVLLKALKQKITSSEAWNNLGLLHWRQSRLEEAYDDLCQAAIYAPNDCVYFNLALCSISLEKYEQALYYYNECVNINPSHYDAFNNKGILLRYLFRIWEALESYDTAIKIDSKNPCALCNSAFLLKDLGYNERAIQRYHMALEERPNDVSIHHALGILYCRIDDFLTAAYHFDKSYTYPIVNLLREELERKIAIIDIGYEVFYLIEVEFTKRSVQVHRVDSEPNFGMFNIPLMREWLKQAHINNKPLSPEDPRKFFAPEPLSSGDLCKAIDAMLRGIEYQRFIKS